MALLLRDNVGTAGIEEDAEAPRLTFNALYYNVQDFQYFTDYCRWP